MNQQTFFTPLYRIETSSIKFSVVYVKAKDMNDAMFKARKYFELSETVLSDDLFSMIRKIELISNILVE